MYQPAFNAKDLTVLVVDDFATMRRIIKNMLKDMGFDFVKIIEASDGVEALVKIKSMAFDLVLTDWNMPNMNGLELVKKIRADGSHIKTPIIMITTEGGRGEVIAALRAGVNNYIVKPFPAETLKEKLDTVLNVRK